MRSSRKLFYSTGIQMIITGDIINGKRRYMSEEKAAVGELCDSERKINDAIFKTTFLR